jgi:voltage-gated potassium channel
MDLPHNKIRRQIYIIIFGSTSRLGKLFDIVLLYTIIISLLIVMLESVQSINNEYGSLLRIIEWIVTVLFSIEYILRIYSVPQPRKYLFSFLGVVDFLSFFPTYLIFFVPGLQFLVALRVIRLLRVFRILKLQRYIKEIEIITRSLNASKYKIFIFMMTVLSVVIIIGTLMYIIEGPEHGFTSIPTSIYWAIVTITTVGYGDIAPMTIAGKFLASFLMFTGYSILAVPTGIATVEFSKQLHKRSISKKCKKCITLFHESDALYCRNCGEKLVETTDSSTT